MCVLFVFVFFDARAQARTYKSFSKFFFGIEMYFLTHCACCRDVLGPLGRTESRYFRARKCPTRIIFSDLIRVGMCRSRLKLPVSLSSSPKNPRANIIKRRVSRASDGIPASRGGVSNASRALMCRINFMHQTLLCEASKKKSNKKQRYPPSPREQRMHMNGIEIECSF